MGGVVAFDGLSFSDIEQLNQDDLDDLKESLKEAFNVHKEIAGLKEKINYDVIFD